MVQVLCDALARPIMPGLQLMLLFNGGKKITAKLEKKITKSMVEPSGRVSWRVVNVDSLGYSTLIGGRGRVSVPIGS